MILTIITINLNNRDGLRKTIESVVSQTWRDYEFIVIDGASSDGSADVIQEFSDRIDYWVSEPDTGIYSAMNKGISKAKGEYLLFLNSGDSLHSTFSLHNAFQHDFTQTDIAAFDYCTIDANGKLVLKCQPEFSTPFFLYNHTINHQSTLIRKSLLHQGYSNQFRYSSDYLFWLQSILIKNYKYQHIPSILSCYDITGISSKWNGELEAERICIQKSCIPKPYLDHFKSLKAIQPFIEEAEKESLIFRVTYLFFWMLLYARYRINWLLRK